MTKGVTPKSQLEKRCEIQGGSQEMAVMVGKTISITNINNSISGEFVLPSVSFIRI